MPELPSLETVSPDDFRRIREVFDSALSRPEPERRAYVVQACGDNTLILMEVERMLAAEAEHHGLFDRRDLAGTPRRHEGLGTQCSSCNGMLGATDRFCRACGTPAGALLGDEGRFRAGALFASRFRIVARLGRGGMGEVYRAHDLELGQPVALKFLTGPARAGEYAQAVGFDERARARLRNEVRLARQLAHPNVCRVYDIGEAHGDLYLSMEYVDGEDLAALLKRIGRVPIDKGIEIARKLCAGLAAAHAKGVLHRDFKPANIMIDSRGEVRIMDFGLAAIADQLDTSDAFSGTPAYMAPEQLAGTGATRQSDLYALGLVLYELFTGKPPFAGKDLQELQRQRAETPKTTPSTLIPDLSPRLESAILRCLEPEPNLRPASALEVAVSLPGGDPLAEALAAGETPSPDLLAASGPREALRPRTAAVLLACVAAVFVTTIFLAPRAQTVARLPLKHPPEVLTEKARELIRALGYTGDPVDSASGFRNESGWLESVGTAMPADASRQAWTERLSLAPYPVAFWYRQGASALVPPLTTIDLTGRAAPSRRMPLVSDEVAVDLDLDGRLLKFRAAVHGSEHAGNSSDTTPGWDVLFNAAQFDSRRFTRVEPRSIALDVTDQRVAWTGDDGSPLSVPVRVEAGAYQGRPVYFEVLFPWTTGSSDSLERAGSTPSRYSTFLLLVTLFGFLVGGAVVARHNWKTGRADVRGAALVGVATFATNALALILGAHNTLAFNPFSLAMAEGVFAAILYMALEPWVRRLWPHALITWSRVLAGHWRDPVVGRDVLIAVLAAVAINCVRHVLYLGFSPSGAPAASSITELNVLQFTLDQLMGTRFIGSAGFIALGIGLTWALRMFFLMFLCRVCLRRPWLATLAFVGLVAPVTLAASFSQGDWIESIVLVLIVVFNVLTMVRLGLLALAVQGAVGVFIQYGLLTNDFGAWYGESSLVVVVVVSALALWAFRTSLGGRPLLSADPLKA
jgi:predicted Ser/Thr protein kinase